MENQFRPVASLHASRSGNEYGYSITNKGSAPASVQLYGEIGQYGVTAEAFVADLMKVHADAIDVHINTPGGDVFDGIAIMNALKGHSAHVTTYVDSAALSIGSVIAQAGDKRVMAQNSQMMIHDGQGICFGNASDMTRFIDLLDKTSNNIASVYAARAGGNVDDWRTRMQAETWYSADEAVAIGLADEVAGQALSNHWDLSNFHWDLSNFHYKGREITPAAKLVAKEVFKVEEVQQDNYTFDPELFRKAMKEAAK